MIGGGAGYSRRHLRPFWLLVTHNRLAALTAPAASPRWRRCAEPRLWSAASHCQSSPGLLLEVDVGQCPPVLVADDETGAGLIDVPRRREAASRGHRVSASPRAYGAPLQKMRLPRRRRSNQTVSSASLFLRYRPIGLSGMLRGRRIDVVAGNSCLSSGS